MNGYTSGTQALQGRTVNHDPRPYQVYADGVPSWRRNFHRERFGNGFGDVITDTYRPRPEFDVLDNPILAEFRRSFGNAKTLPATAWPNAKPDAVIQRWLRWVDNPNASSDDPEPWTAAERSHARRVLAKLAALA